MTKGFQLNQEEVFEGYEDVTDGTYEVIIEHVREDANVNRGAEFAQATMAIRNDLDQKHKNGKVWHKIYKAKATGKYPMIMFNTIGKAARLENGKTYNSFEELLSDFEGKPVRVTLKNETSEYKGQTYENLNVKKWEQTAFPNVQHQLKGGAGAKTSNSVAPELEIDEDDLPF